MEKDPINNSENNTSGNDNDGGLGQMPSFHEHMTNFAKSEQSSRNTMDEYRKLRFDNKLPEGVRDYQDYQEFLEEQEARAAERMEKIDTFEKRLEMNKKLYDAMAYQRACRLAMNKDEYEDYHRSDIGDQIYLLENLYYGVVDDDIDNSTVVQWHYGTTSGKSVDTGEIVLPKRGDEDIFKRAFSEFAALSLMTPDDNLFNLVPPSKRIGKKDYDKRVKEMMDASKYEKDFDKFLSMNPEEISSYDINRIEGEINHLNSCSDNLFGFEHDGSYTSFTLNEKTAIIPTLESRIRLEEQTILVKERIANVIADVKTRELEADLRKSAQGRRVSKRLENKQQC